MKPQLANDVDFATLPYPVWGMAKIDGVRAMHTTGQLTGRSLDPFKGFGVTEMFSDAELQGFDGEMILGPDPKADRLCSLTTGAMGAFKGITEAPDLHWWLFDMLTPGTLDLPYVERYKALQRKLQGMGHQPRLHLVPAQVVANEAEARALYASYLDMGYEGIIYRNPRAKAKPGRPSKALQELVRAKPWMDSEMLVTGITEGFQNNNEKKTNTLGQSERSSAKAGKVPNAMVGSLQGTLLEDIRSPVTGKLLFAKGLAVTISPGKMTDKEALAYFAQQDTIVGHIAKFSHLAHGTKNLPRMGGFLTLRLPEDMA